MTYPTEENHFFRLIFDSSPVAMILVDDRGLIELANHQAERLFGYDCDQLHGERIEVLVPQDKQTKHQMERLAFIENPESRPMGAGRFVQAIRRDGSKIPVEVGLTPIVLRDRLHVLASIIDLTYQKRVEEKALSLAEELGVVNQELARLARTDELTGLKNRRAFEEGLSNLIQLMDRIASTISLLLIDVDHYKEYNDDFGHPAGDELLITIADLLLHNSRKSDLVARYGGDEFAILMPGTNATGSVRVGERIRLSVQDHPWEGKTPSISLGAATISFKEEKVGTLAELSARLLSDTDRALYHSKKSGRNKLTHIKDIQE